MKTSTKNLILRIEQKIRLVNNIKALPWTVFPKGGGVVFINSLKDVVQTEMAKPNLSKEEIEQLTELLTKIHNSTLNKQ